MFYDDYYHDVSHYDADDYVASAYDVTYDDDDHDNDDDLLMIATLQLVNDLFHPLLQLPLNNLFLLLTLILTLLLQNLSTLSPACINKHK